MGCWVQLTDEAKFRAHVDFRNQAYILDKIDED